METDHFKEKVFEMDELTSSGATPRCSTALDGCLQDELNDSLRDAFFNDTDRTRNDPLENLKETIESLKLDQPEQLTVVGSNSCLTASDSAYASMRALSEASRVATELQIDDDDDPESEHIRRFREFGVRFIRSASQYVSCNCLIPERLKEWQSALSEVAVERSAADLPICFQFRWAETKQNFEIDTYGDLQFQDFLLGREQRGPYHAMIHFAGIFANVGYDMKSWYWVLTTGDSEFPFFEENFRTKCKFIDGLSTMIEQMSAENSQGHTCPEIDSSSRLFIRPAYDEQCRPEESFFDDQAENHAFGSPENIQRSTDTLVNERPGGPRSLSYLELYSQSYYDILSTLY